MRAAAIAFLAGLCILHSLGRLPGSDWVWLLPVALAATAWRWTRWPAWLVVGVLWGLWSADPLLDRRIDPGIEGIDLVAEGTVVSIPAERRHSIRFAFDIHRLYRDGEPVSPPGRVRLNWYGRAPELEAGRGWRLTVRLKRPNGFMNPGGFDYEGWLFRNGYGATGYVRADGVNERVPEADRVLSLHRVRQHIAQGIAEVVGDHPQGGLITALAIGERSGLTQRQWDVLIATGTNHLVAISGLHVGLVGSLAFVLMRRVWALSSALTTWWPAPKAGAVAALGAAATYAALAGFAVPTQRALIMLAVAMGAVLLQRHTRPSHVLALALVVVLLVDPFAALAPGFWLSFGAVAIILYGMGARVGRGSLWWRWGSVQWLVALGLLPLTLLFFQRASLVAPLANLLAVPLVSLAVVPLVLIGTLALALGIVGGDWLLLAAAALLEQVWPALAWLGERGFADWSHRAPEPPLMVAAVAGVALLLAPGRFPARWTGILMLWAATMAPVAVLPSGAFELTLLDVGQGLAAVVRTRHHTLVYDTGPRFSDTFDTGAAVVVPFLRDRGVARVDEVVITHGDNDHIGGLQSVLRRIPVDRVRAGVVETVEGTAARACRAGQAWEWDGVRFRVLHPPADPAFRENDRSCVLLIEGPGGRALLTGDIEARSERRLLSASAEDLHADVLVAPHHGSTTSSSEAFVRAVHPQYVMFPVGYRNRFDFPRAQVLKRYREHAVRCLDTARHGALNVIFEPDTGVSVPGAYRRQAGHYWHRQPLRRAPCTD